MGRDVGEKLGTVVGDDGELVGRIVGEEEGAIVGNVGI